jgi:hypothetical protein
LGPSKVFQVVDKTFIGVHIIERRMRLRIWIVISMKEVKVNDVNRFSYKSEGADATAFVRRVVAWNGLTRGSGWRRPGRVARTFAIKTTMVDGWLQQQQDGQGDKNIESLQEICRGELVLLSRVITVTVSFSK